MVQDKIEIDVGNEMRLDKLLGRLDKMGLRERGFFRAVRKGRQAVTLLLNGDRLDIAEARRTVIREGDELAILSQISGG
jgi:molybdopterin converting factor small subunit